MPTVQATILGGGSIQGFTELGVGALSVDYNVSMHALRFKLLSFASFAEETAKQSALTNKWVDLGVPSGSVVSGVQVLSAEINTLDGDALPLDGLLVNISVNDNTLVSVNPDNPGSYSAPAGLVVTLNDTDQTDARFDVYCYVQPTNDNIPVNVNVYDIVVEITYQSSRKGNAFFGAN